MTELPADVLARITDRTSDGTPHEWTRVSDRDGDLWDVTDITHAGELVLLPWASDMEPATVTTVERAYGPLTPDA